MSRRSTYPRRAPAFTMLVVQARNGNGWNYAPKGTALAEGLRYDDEQGYDTPEEAVAAIRRDRSIPADVRIEYDPDPDATVRMPARELEGAAS